MRNDELSPYQQGLQNIGEIVYAFQMLEEELRSIVAFLVNRDNYTIGRTVTAELSFKQIVQLAGCLTKEYYVIDRGKFDTSWQKLLARALDGETTRNTIVHSTFRFPHNEPRVMVRHKVTAKLKHGLKENVELLDRETMIKHQQNLGKLYMEVTDFFQKEFPRWRTREWEPNWDKQ